jgi:hypothetical protein
MSKKTARTADSMDGVLYPYSDKLISQTFGNSTQIFVKNNLSSDIYHLDLIIQVIRKSTSYA